jgi:hypothetical protein
MYIMTRLLTAFLLLLSAGCTTSMKGVYSPASPPIYTESLHGSVTVSSVLDKRGMKPNAYFVSFRRLDEATYDRSVTDIVREALDAELKRAGAEVQNPAATSTAADGIHLKAEVLEYVARVSRPGIFESDTLDLKVSVRFRWMDSSGKLLEENERSEQVMRQLGMGKAPVMPFGDTQIESYGEELMNTLLPRVIEKEIRLNKALK